MSSTLSSHTLLQVLYSEGPGPFAMLAALLVPMKISQTGSLDRPVPTWEDEWDTAAQFMDEKNDRASP